MKLYDLCQTMEQEHKTFIDMPLRVTFYARVSTKKEAQLNSKEYVDNLKSIEKYFLDMFADKASIANNQIDEIVKTLVDRIEVTPINNNSMSITIVLKAGNKGTLEYVRQGKRYACRSGSISKKMTPEQQMNFTRINRQLKEHIMNIEYIVSIAI